MATVIMVTSRVLTEAEEEARKERMAALIRRVQLEVMERSGSK